MSTDLIEIALERFADWHTFEKLAGEIMRDEGYPDIRPMGGVRDGGEDACTERFYQVEGKLVHTVFQFTLRPDVLTKVRDTIKRLDDTNIKFGKLVMVTAQPIGAERQRKVKRQVLQQHRVDLDIFERKTIANRLSDLGNGIFARCFPDIERQVHVLCQRDAEERKVSADLREREYLKVCCAFAFAKGAARTRKSLLDAAILGVLAANDAQPITVSQVHQAAHSKFGEGVFGAVEQVEASLARLASRGLSEHRPPTYSLSIAGRRKIEAARASVEAAGDSAIEDIVADVVESAAQPVADQIAQRLHRNARAVLVGYFRMNGLELSNCFLQAGPPSLVYSEGVVELIDTARRGLPAHLGDLLATATARALSCPSEDQATYFANCSRAYLALQVMNADPSLREFQGNRFRSKTFLLDTDFVLEAIVKDLPTSSTYRHLVEQLVSIGATVLVPDAVLSEVVTHFDISPKTYDYFGEALASLPEELAVAKVENTLVRGYWYHRRGRSCSRRGFMAYRANHFNVTNSAQFVGDVVREALPGVQIQPIDSYFDVPTEPEHFARVCEAMLELAQKSHLSAYRTDEQSQELASHDALLMTAVLAHNTAAGANPGAVLGRRAFILTTSGRYVRAAKMCGIDDRVSTRPHILVSLLEMVGPSSLEDHNFVPLFENPLLQQAADMSWDNIRVLLDAGIDLRNKTLTRLRHDTEQRLATAISDVREVPEEDEDLAVAKDTALLDEAEALGYKAIPSIAELRKALDEGEGKVRDLMSENEELREAVTTFGRKKARWLRRFDRQRQQRRNRKK